MVTEVSTENLVDKRQIGWVSYREGDAIVRVKVIRTVKGAAIIVPPSNFCKETQQSVPLISYESSQIWKQKQAVLLSYFKNRVGADYMSRFRNWGELKA